MARIHGPLGLDLGGREPAEIVVVRRGDNEAYHAIASEDHVEKLH